MCKIIIFLISFLHIRYFNKILSFKNNNFPIFRYKNINQI